MVQVDRPTIRRALSLFALVAIFLVVLARASAGPSPAKPNPALKACADAAASTYAVAEANYAAGAGNVESVYVWSQRLADAQRAVGVATAGADHLQRMKALEAKVAKAVAAGLGGSFELKAVAYYRADAEANP